MNSQTSPSSLQVSHLVHFYYRPLLYGTNPDLLLADLLLVAAPLFQAKIFSFAARFEFGFPQSFQFFSQTALLSRALFKAKSC